MNICRHHPHFYHLCTSVIVQCQRMRVALVKKRALTRKAGQRLQLEMAHNCVAAIPPCLFVRHVYYFAGCCTSNLASYPLPFLFSAVISVRHRKQGGFRSSRLSAPSSFSFFLFSFFFFFRATVPPRVFACHSSVGPDLMHSQNEFARASEEYALISRRIALKKEGRSFLLKTTQKQEKFDKNTVFPFHESASPRMRKEESHCTKLTLRSRAAKIVQARCGLVASAMDRFEIYNVTFVNGIYQAD